MKILLITPPLLQPNTPYPATPILTAWLRSQGHDAVQADLSLELQLKLFSREGLTTLFQTLEPTASGRRFLEQADAYLETIGPVMTFLQGKNDSLNVALPEGPHLTRAYEQEEQLGWNFRGLDDEDRARHLCSLYLDDLAEAFRLVDPDFGFSRYAEHLSSDFPMLGKSDSFIFQRLEKLTDEVVEKHQPELVVLTVPFPGCLVGALSIAGRINHTFKGTVQIAMGGGYVNTELRELSDPRIFDCVDYVCLDSGMVPLLRLANGETPVRTFVCDDSTHPGLRPPLQRRGIRIQKKNPSAKGCAQRGVRFYEDDGTLIPHDSLPAPTFDGLPLDRYFGLFEVLNPVTRLWTDGRWNKLMLAYGCCWRRCAFCDTAVDYVCRYDPATPQTVCDWMESMMAENGFSGFHFVDEALPPDRVDGLCDEILKRGLDVEWWGNIRFEKRFSAELIDKMARAGCIAVTGGLETCCDRTLKLMRKGITVEGASGVIRNFADAGILTHAYLMLGFPTQTQEETFQALDTVRCLMEEGVLHSVYWHRFALTAHSEIARDPQRFGIRLLPENKTGFARNEIPFEADFDYDPESVGAALRAAAYNYNLGLGFDVPVFQWLENQNRGSESE